MTVCLKISNLDKNLSWRERLTFKTISINETFAGQVVELILNSPPANILSAAMMLEIRAFLAADQVNKQRKLIVIKGSGDSFCFGASVEEHTAEQVNNMLPGFHQLCADILTHPVATLAQVSGLCLGGGFELALSCSLIFADETAKFAVPEIQLGVFPPVAAALLPILAGGTLANEMLLTGKKFPATALAGLGVVSSVSSQADLQQDISSYIEKNLLPRSASSLRFAHQAARLTVVNHYQATIPVLEKLYLDELMASHDANEGINAFIEKRKPEWNNS